MSNYHDIDGDLIILCKLCRDEPDWAANRIERLSAENALMREAMQEFVARCEKGLVRSRYTYGKFKDILESVLEKPAP